MEVKNVRTFGGEYLWSQMLEKLQLKECLLQCGLNPGQVDRALISIAARALFASSEHKTSQLLAMNSDLQHCFGSEGLLSHRELYEVSDTLYEHKSVIDEFLYERLKEIFDLNDKLVIFDISNPYFETSKRSSVLAKHGRSKEKRSDCPLVVFTGVIDAHGFIRHSRI